MIRKVVLLVAGAFTLCLAAGFGFLAYSVHSTFSSDGRLVLTLGTLELGPARTLVVDIDRFSAEVPYLDSLGSTKLVVSTPSTSFVGIAGTQDLDNLLRGTTYVVGMRQTNSWITSTVPGRASAVEPHTLAAQKLWLAAAQGTQVELAVPQSRPITMVVAGEQSLDGVTVGAVFELSHSSLLVTLGAIAAGILAVGGVVLLGLGLRPARRGVHNTAADTESPSEG
jgi:hypothetical protein